MIGVAKSLSARFKNQTVIPLGGHIFSGFRRIIFQNVINVHAVQLRFFARVAMILRAASSNSLKSLTTKTAARLLTVFCKICSGFARLPA